MISFVRALTLSIRYRTVTRNSSIYGAIDGVVTLATAGRWMSDAVQQLTLAKRN